jgi:branched-chain amino acid transport system substrate-binding protein
MPCPSLPTSRVLAVLGLAAALGLPCAVRAQAGANPIRIGVVLSLTGPLAVAGQPERDGIALAVKQVNAAGGLQGRPIEAVIEDDASSPETALAKTNNLVFNRQVKAVLGATGIASTVAMGGLTAPRNLPQLAFTGLGPAVERERNCVFHLTPAQELNARSLLEYAARELKARKLAILHDTGFGAPVAASLRGLAAEYGVSIVGVEKVDLGATDATPQAAKLRSTDAEALLVIASSPTPFRSVRQMKIATPVVAAHPSAPYDVVKAMGDGAEGVVFADFLVAEEPLPHQKAFVDAFQKEYGRLPKNFDAAGFDAVQILVRALQKAGPDAPGEQLCAAMRTAQPGVLAAYDLAAPDMGGLKVSSFVYSKFQNGRFSRLKLRTAP